MATYKLRGNMPVSKEFAILLNNTTGDVDGDICDVDSGILNCSEYDRCQITTIGNVNHYEMYILGCKAGFSERIINRTFINANDNSFIHLDVSEYSHIKLQSSIDEQIKIAVLLTKCDEMIHKDNTQRDRVEVLKEVIETHKYERSGEIKVPMVNPEVVVYNPEIHDRENNSMKEEISIDPLDKFFDEKDDESISSSKDIEVTDVQLVDEPNIDDGVDMELLTKYKHYRGFKQRCIDVIKHAEHQDTHQMDLALNSFKRTISFLEYIKLCDIKQRENQLANIYDLLKQLEINVDESRKDTLRKEYAKSVG